MSLDRNAAPAESGLSDLQVRDIVLLLRRRKLNVIVMALLGIILALLYTTIAQRTYSATTTIEVNKEGGGSLGLNDLSGIGSQLGGGDQMTTDLLTQQTVIINDTTALAVIKKLNLTSVPPYAIPPAKAGKETALSREEPLPLDEAPLKRDRILSLFHSRLSVSLIKGTRLIGVTYTDSDPIRAAHIANAIVDAYITEYTQARYDASTKTSLWLTSKLNDLKTRVSDGQKKIDEFQRQTGLIGMAQGSDRTGKQGGGGVPSQDVAVERFVELNRALTSAQVERIAKEAIYRMTAIRDVNVVLGIGSSQLVSGLNGTSVLSAGSSEIALLQQLRQQQASLVVQLSTQSGKYGSKNPIIIGLRTQLDATNGQIEAELNHIHDRAKSDFDVANTAERGLRERIGGQEQEVSKLSNSVNQLLLLQQEESSSRQLYQDLYTKLEEANVAAGVKASNITVVDPARVPSTPSSPVVLRSLRTGLLIGLMLGLVLAFVRDYLDESILSPAQLEGVTTSPLLGLVPLFAKFGSATNKRGRPDTSGSLPQDDLLQSWVLRAPKSIIAEAYRSLRTTILMSRADKPPQVILVTSALSGDGKSTTCFNLAASFALKGDRVLLIDADMRRPSIHMLTSRKNNVGLSNVLTSAVSPSDAIQPYPGIDTLSIMTAGIIPPLPSELLGSRRFADVLASLKEQYDFIFFDTPPLLLVSDALVISTSMDEVILVVRSGKTTNPILRRSLAALSTPNIPFLGIILNAADTASSDYATYGYYGYGKGSYYAEEEK